MKPCTQNKAFIFTLLGIIMSWDVWYCIKNFSKYEITFSLLRRLDNDLFFGDFLREDLNEPLLGSFTIQDGGTIILRWGPSELIIYSNILIDWKYKCLMEVSGSF